ncbi:M28 family peptidase [Prevotella brunnea]|uniref:M28 family peptidase n=1 Tax=Prevotella brunnea TaxID=2508867 RepID=A0A5C8GHX3_9BACT|nr:M28 family peptidase [Prevotella brunnea]MDR0185707.1 M28 family peptidase [Prevotella brunnea]TXJ61613.1 M28 family peptidase [Prevotella brunnea]
MKMKLFLGITAVTLFVLFISGCNRKKNDNSSDIDTMAVEKPVDIKFNPDSAYAFTAAQCAFGPRVMNSAAHDRCEQWIISKFKQYGCEVMTQKADLKGYDGTLLKSTNILASYNPQAQRRVMLCAHWDSRPWADNDPDSANHKKPVMAANDGASGVAVMIEVARLLQADSSLNIGVDFVCFDAEDWGIPQWETNFQDTGDSWALGSTYFSLNLPQGFRPEFAVLLDMVGGEAAQFYREGISKQFAASVVDMVWAAAKVAGYGSYFPDADGGMITDDHYPMNRNANIPTIDIIPYYPDCPQSTFGPTWHTVNDTMEHIDKATLQAVGQTLIQLLYTC